MHKSVRQVDKCDACSADANATYYFQRYNFNTIKFYLWLAGRLIAAKSKEIQKVSSHKY